MNLKGKELISKVKAPEGKTIVCVDTSKVDTLAFDIKEIRMGRVVSGTAKDNLIIFGPHFAVITTISTSDFHYLVMEDNNIHCILEAENE